MEGSGSVQIIKDPEPGGSKNLRIRNAVIEENLIVWSFGSATWRRGTLGPWSRCSCCGIPSWRLQCKQTMLSSCGRYNKIMWTALCSIPLFRISTYRIQWIRSQSGSGIWIQDFFLTKLKKNTIGKFLWSKTPTGSSRMKFLHFFPLLGDNFGLLGSGSAISIWTRILIRWCIRI